MRENQDFEMFKEAGDVYARCDMNDLAASCYCQSHMWDEAGKQFEKAKRYVKAVDTYENGRHYYAIFELTRR